jgi:hypothetical protein
MRRALWAEDYLIRYAENGCAPIDNNLLERDIRPFGMPDSLCCSF